MLLKYEHWTVIILGWHKNQYTTSIILGMMRSIALVPSVNIKLKNEWAQLEDSSSSQENGYWNTAAWKEMNDGRTVDATDVADVSKEQLKFQKSEIDQHTAHRQKCKKSACFSCATNDVNVRMQHWLILSFSTWQYVRLPCSGSHVCVIYLKIHNLPPKIQ